MTQSKNRTRMQLRRYTRLILLQWVLIAALIITVILVAVFVPRVKAADREQSALEPVVESVSVITPTPVETSAPTETSAPAPVLTELGEFKLTAYCACKQCCGKDPGSPYYGITASGTTATAGRTIAVDPSVIPYGSEVVINGHTYIAEDCGGAIKENRIDIYFDTHEEALNFGVQHATVYLINNNI